MKTKLIDILSHDMDARKAALKAQQIIILWNEMILEKAKSLISKEGFEEVLSLFIR